MGSKNLKAIHVNASTKPRSLSDYRREAKAAVQKLQADPGLDGLRRYGTLVLMDPKNVSGDQPAKNHQLVQVPFIANINASAFDAYLIRHKACYTCPIICSRHSSVVEGPYSVELEGPEYGTTNALGPMCWISNPEVVIYANHWCNEKVFPEEILSELMDPANEKYKPDLVVYGEHFCAVTDSLGICKFSTVEMYSLLPEDIAPGISAHWGNEITAEDLLLIGERIVNLERLYNVRLGLSRHDDTLPERFTQEPAPLYEYEADSQTGELTALPDPLRVGQVHDLDAMLDRYYSLRGWDDWGNPTKEVPQRLGLLDVASDVSSTLSKSEGSKERTMDKQELLEKLQSDILGYDAKSAVETAQAIVDSGILARTWWPPCCPCMALTWLTWAWMCRLWRLRTKLKAKAPGSSHSRPCRPPQCRIKEMWSSCCKSWGCVTGTTLSSAVARSRPNSRRRSELMDGA